MEAKFYQKGKKQTNCCSKTAGSTYLVNMKEAAELRKKPGLEIRKNPVGIKRKQLRKGSSRRELGRK